MHHFIMSCDELSHKESETSSTIYSSSEENETCRPIKLKTPKKRKYRRSLHHGITKKMATYFNVTPEKSCAGPSYLSRNNDVPRTFDRTNPGFLCNGQVSHISDDKSSHDSSSIYDTTTDSCSSSQLSSAESDVDNESSDDSTTTTNSRSNVEESLDDSMNVDATAEFRDADMDEMDIPLYEGCRQTQRSAYIMIMLFVMHNSLSNEAFSGLLQLISSFLPEHAKFTKSVYRIKETLKSTVELQKPIKHTYCEECQQYCENGERCENAACNLDNGSRLLEFVDLNLEQQIKDLFKDNVFLRSLRKTQTECAIGDSPLRDILDGSFYKNNIKLLQTGADVYITFTMNTDGVSLFSSSKKGSLWPVYLAINELPVKLRFSRKYLMPCVLHCQVEKPNMFTYLKPLMKTLQKLHREGIEVDTPEGKFVVKGHLLASSLDLPARALVSYMKQFNGKQACCVCLDEGETVQGNALHRFYPFQENMTKRSNETFRQDATEAARTGVVVHGIKGPSSLLMLPYTDMAEMFPVDWMHCVHLGITKALMGFWFDAKHRREDYFIGDKMALLNKRFLSLKIPDFVSRRQRGLNDHGHWKASECREWLIHFSTAVLYGILPAIPYVHHLLLVSAMSLLSKDGIKVEDIDRAENMLMLYCKMYPEIYGEPSQTMNVHLLRHLPSTVRQFGPLYGFSCYGFESMNSYLKSMVHGTGHVNSQVCFAVGMSKQITSLLHQFIHGNVDDTIKSLAESLGSKLIKEDKTSVRGRVTPLGQRKPLNPASNYYNAVDADIRADNPSVFLRLQNGEEVLYSKDYQNRKTRNSYTICFIHNQEEKYGSVVNFICTSKSYAVVEKFHTEKFKLTQEHEEVIANTQLSEFDKLCEHIVMVVSEATECLIIPVENIVTKCVFMKIGLDLIFLSKPPNLLEHN